MNSHNSKVYQNTNDFVKQIPDSSNSFDIPLHIKEFTKKFIDKTITQSEKEKLDEWMLNGNTHLFIREYKKQTRLDS